MIEEGIALLVQGDADVAAIAVNGGGYLKELPKDFVLPSWTHQTISQSQDYTLRADKGLIQRRIQVDCYADDPDVCLQLAAAVDGVLSGYSGTLTDADSTVVQGIFQSNAIDLYDDASRSYRRSLEYEVWFNQGS